MMRGSLRFIEKPFDIKEVRSIVEDILKKGEGFQGTIDGIDLMDIVQFNGLSRSTAALKVTTGEQEGMIFFKDGAVVHAMCGDQSGEDAFFTILGFNGGTLQNIRGVHPPIVSIHKSLEGLLFEVAVKNDETTAPEEENVIDEAFNPDFTLPGTENIPEATEQPELENLTKLTTEIENIDTNEELINSEEDFEMTKIQEILAEFTNIEGVHTACLVGRDGFLLDSLARTDIDAEMIGAIASSGFGSAESMGNQLGQGDLKMTMFEFENGPVMFAPVGTEAFLVIVADQDTNLGWIRISIKKNSKKIAEAAEL